MKNITLAALLILISVSLLSCSKKRGKEDLVFKDNIAYLAGSGEPFSGNLLDFYDKDKTKQKLEENYLNGYKEGQCVYYYTGGEIERKVTYKHGKIEGNDTTFLSNGKIKRVIGYSNGRKNGQAKEFYDDGQISTERYFTDDKLVKITSYYKTGSMRYESAINSKSDIIPVNALDYQGRILDNAYMLQNTVFPLESVISAYKADKTGMISILGKPTITKTPSANFTTFIYCWFLDGLENIPNMDFVELRCVMPPKEKKAMGLTYLFNTDYDRQSVKKMIIDILNRSGFRVVDENNRKINSQELGFWDQTSVTYENAYRKMRILELSDLAERRHRLQYLFIGM